MKRIRIELKSLKESRPQEYAIRFLFGGALTVVTGLIAKTYGPVIGGLFLAFPAIFPASATLTAKHSMDRHGGKGQARWGEKAAAVDASGAAIGSLALLVFGAVVWKLGSLLSPVLTLTIAGASWFICALLFWGIKQKRFFSRFSRRRRSR